MVTTLTITATPEALARALRSLQADEQIHIAQPKPQQQADNVLPFRQAESGALPLSPSGDGSERHLAPASRGE